jgi:hypothetical protein
MSNRLPKETLNKLRPLERELKAAVSVGKVERAIELTIQIQALFDDRRHHRLLKAKLWAFEAALDANRLEYASSGFEGIRQLSNTGTRINLEASSLLAICYLRQKQTAKAKRLIRYAIQNINAITTDRTRNQFQKRLVDRIEEECILAELIGTGSAGLDPQEIHDQSVQLVQHNSDQEILKLIGNSVPPSGIGLLRDMRDYSIKLLPPPDQKLLPAPEAAEKPITVGKKTLAILKRISWKMLCDEESELYRLWSKQMPKVFDKKFFATSLAVSMAQWRIGIPMIAAGVAAIAMKTSAEVFCSMTKPKTLMIDRNEKDAG